MNVAQRLQSVAKPGQVVVSEPAYEKLKEAFQCVLVGEMNLKNKANALLIYEVVE
ncbi:Adenylate and Guanylate cyclase catalytic domain protein [compost metagenome]